MKTSIIIPVYNAANTLGALVDGLVKILTRTALEIILVNDGSTDNSHEVCVLSFEKYKNIRNVSEIRNTPIKQ